MTTTTGSITHTPAAASATALSVRRLNVMRAGYLFMGLGLVAVKWPLLPDAHTLPLHEGVTVCVLVAMSLFALLGVRYPTKLLPLLLETTWKFIWLSVVALPTAIAVGERRRHALVVVEQHAGGRHAFHPARVPIVRQGSPFSGR